MAEKIRKSGKSGNHPARFLRVLPDTGIEAFSRGAGTSCEDVVALVSFLLCGMAGGEAWLGGYDSGTPLSKLDLLVRREDLVLRQVTGQLLARVRGLNRDLAVGAGDLNPGVMALIRRGAYAGGREAKYADPADTDEARQRFLDKLKGEGDPADTLKRDMAEKVAASRLEALLHPLFLLESVRCRELAQALDQCHQRTAVVVALKTDSGREGSEPARDLRGLLDLMEGLATPPGPATGGNPRVMPLKAHVLLDAGGIDLSLMAGLLPQMPGRFLWLSSLASAGRCARPDDGSVAAGAGLMRSFTHAALEILSLRRAGEVVAFDHEGPFAAKYLRGMSRYRRWVGHVGARHGVDPGPVVRELPGALWFGLGFLCRHGGGAAGFSTDAVMAAAFRMARRLARRHCRELALFLNADRVERGVELARRIVENLEEKGPLSRRQLVRCFGDQRKARFEPVIEALHRLGALVRLEDGKLAAGATELSEVEDVLREALLTPVPAGAAVGNAGQTKTPGKTRARTSRVPQAESDEKPRKKPGGKADGKDR